MIRNNSTNVMRNDDLIPNEEPLINVREFWGSNKKHKYRMRLALNP